MDVPSINLLNLKEELVSRLVEAKINRKQLIVVLSARRTGLRYKLFHAFIEYCGCGKPSHNHEMREVTDQVRRQMKGLDRVPS